jgi:hypothetical protein
MTTIEFIKAIVTAQHGWAVADQFESTFDNPSPSNFNEKNQDSLDLIKETISDIISSNILNYEIEDELNYYLDCLENYDNDNNIDDGFDDYDYDKGLFDI